MKDKNAQKVIIGLLIYLVIMLVLFLPGYLKRKHEKLYILSGAFIKIKYENGRWSNIKNSNDYKLQEFSVYDNNQYMGKYKVLFSNRLNLYDSTGNSISYNGPLFAYRGTLDLVVNDLIQSDFEEVDSYIIQQVLSSLGISYTEEYNLFQKVSLDVDHDGMIETVYCISNYYVEHPSETVFSIVFIHKNNNNYILNQKVISSDLIYEEPSFEIHQVFDIHNDGKYEILFTKGYYSRPESECAMLYNLYDERKLIHNFCD